MSAFEEPDSALALFGWSSTSCRLTISPAFAENRIEYCDGQQRLTLLAAVVVSIIDRSFQP
jgi:hypothetical protein